MLDTWGRFSTGSFRRRDMGVALGVWGFIVLSTRRFVYASYGFEGEHLVSLMPVDLDACPPSATPGNSSDWCSMALC